MADDKRRPPPPVDRDEFGAPPGITAPAPERKVYTKFRKENRCRFCRDGIPQIDYKDLNALSKLTSGRGKIFSRRRTGNCAWHQRSAQRAVKYARYLALLPYVGGGMI